MKRRHFNKQLFMSYTIAAALLLTGCAQAAGNAPPPSSTQSAESTIAPEDTQTAWDEQNAVRIAFSGSEATVTGAGAVFSGGTLTLSKPGTYVLSGTLDDGQIRIDAGKKDTIRLILNGVSITSKTSAALYEAKADKVIVTLADGTVNSLTDASEYVYAQGETEPDAAMYLQNSLTINGNGTLSVTGSYNHGIVAKDDLVITGGTINVNANGTGIRGRDTLTITGGDITVNATGDALQSNNDEDSTKGNITISSGTFHLTSAKDGIQAETTLNITGGSFTIYSGGKTKADAATGQSQDGSGADQNRQGKSSFPAQGGQWRIPGSTTTDNTESGKGLKATGDITISGGTFEIYAQDDSIHTGANALIYDGTFTLETGDDGIHADGDITIKGGTITVTQSYEGLEAANINVEGGKINILASDDGINAAGGNDETTTTDWRRPRGFEAAGDYSVKFSGGEVYISAQGDGLDSNGNIYMSGGTVMVDGPTNNGNAALDYNGNFEITGGTLMASGSAGMAQAPSALGGQVALMVYGSGSGAITLTDTSGNALIHYTPSKTYQSVVISTPDMKQGETYTLSISGQEHQVTLTDNITTFSTDGTQGGGFNQRFPGGGGPRRP